MWETELLSKIPKSQFFTRKELYLALKDIEKNLSYNSLGWIIDKGIKANVIYKVGSDSYSRKKDNRKTYSPKCSKFAKTLVAKMTGRFPELRFTVFETLLLNEFVNHLYAQNIVVLQVEKDLCPFVFEFLNEKYTGKILFNPSQEDFARYKSDNCIVLENLVSEAPYDKEKPYFMTLEKLLVDCVADKAIKNLTPDSEVANIFENAKLLYKSDLTKIKRYAKRRNAWDRVETLLGQESET